MVGTESASVRAGNYMYLFFNTKDQPQIDFWKVAEKSRDPKRYQVSVDGNTALSGGGAITAIYLEKTDEIHLYYIGTLPGKTVPHLREVCLRKVSQDGEPGPWDAKTQAVNKKGFKIDSESMLCSAIDSNGNPRVFYNEYEELGEVNFAEFGDVKDSAGKKDWTTTRFTGLSG